MSDIVERLRDHHEIDVGGDMAAIYREAADEIERLTARAEAAERELHKWKLFHDLLKQENDRLRAELDAIKADKAKRLRQGFL